MNTIKYLYLVAICAMIDIIGASSAYCQKYSIKSRGILLEIEIENQDSLLLLKQSFRNYSGKDIYYRPGFIVKENMNFNKKILIINIGSFDADRYLNTKDLPSYSIVLMKDSISCFSFKYFISDIDSYEEKNKVLLSFDYLVLNDEINELVTNIEKFKEEGGDIYYRIPKSIYSRYCNSVEIEFPYCK